MQVEIAAPELQKMLVEYAKNTTGIDARQLLAHQRSNHVKCAECNLHKPELEFAFCTQCGNTACIDCILPAHLAKGHTAYWEKTYEPVAATDLDKCADAKCSHRRIMHDATGCNHCHGRVIETDDKTELEQALKELDCANFVQPQAQQQTDIEKFWTAFDNACNFCMRTFLSESNRKRRNKGEPLVFPIPWCDAGTLYSFTQSMYGWEWQKTKQMVNSALEANTMLDAVVSSFTDNKFLGKFTTAYVRPAEMRVHLQKQREAAAQQAQAPPPTAAEQPQQEPDDVIEQDTL